MQHILRGYPRTTAHQHATVAEARQCQDEADHEDQQERELARAEIEAEQAIERYFETDLRLREETALEAAREAALW